MLSSPLSAPSGSWQFHSLLSKAQTLISVATAQVLNISTRLTITLWLDLTKLLELSAHLAAHATWMPMLPLLTHLLKIPLIWLVWPQQLEEARQLKTKDAQQDGTQLHLILLTRLWTIWKPSSAAPTGAMTQQDHSSFTDGATSVWVDQETTATTLLRPTS